MIIIPFHPRHDSLDACKTSAAHLLGREQRHKIAQTLRDRTPVARERRRSWVAAALRGIDRGVQEPGAMAGRRSKALGWFENLPDNQMSGDENETS